MATTQQSGVDFSSMSPTQISMFLDRAEKVIFSVPIVGEKQHQLIMQLLVVYNMAKAGKLPDTFVVVPFSMRRTAANFVHRGLATYAAVPSHGKKLVAITGTEVGLLVGYLVSFDRRHRAEIIGEDNFKYNPSVGHYQHLVKQQAAEIRRLKRKLSQLGG